MSISRMVLSEQLATQYIRTITDPDELSRFKTWYLDYSEQITKLEADEWNELKSQFNPPSHPTGSLFSGGWKGYDNQ